MNYDLPISPPIPSLRGDCFFGCGRPLSEHPVYEGTCYPVCAYIPPAEPATPAADAGGGVAVRSSE